MASPEPPNGRSGGSSPTSRPFSRPCTAWCGSVPDSATAGSTRPSAVWDSKSPASGCTASGSRKASKCRKNKAKRLGSASPATAAPASEPSPPTTSGRGWGPQESIHDRDERGRPIRWLAIIDEYTRECLVLDGSRSFKSEDVLDVLRDLFVIRGVPSTSVPTTAQSSSLRPSASSSTTLVSIRSTSSPAHPGKTVMPRASTAACVTICWTPSYSPTCMKPAF